VVAAHDDVFIVGPPDAVIDSAVLLRKEALGIGLHTVDSKTKIWCQGCPALEARARKRLDFWKSRRVAALAELEAPRSSTDPRTSDLQRASQLVPPTPEFSSGVMVFSVPVGDDSFVRDRLQEQTDEIVTFMRSTLAATVGTTPEQKHIRADRGTQEAWIMLFYSASRKFEYWLTLCHPSQTAEFAAQLDLEALQLAAAAFGTAPFTAPDGAKDCQDFINNRLHLPMRNGGMGLRSLTVDTPLLYLGGLEQALPAIGLGDKRPTGAIRPQLAQWVGSVRTLRSEDPYSTFLLSGLRTAAEMEAARQAFAGRIDAFRTLPDGSEIPAGEFKTPAGEVVEATWAVKTPSRFLAGAKGTLKRQLSEELYEHTVARMHYDIVHRLPGDYRHKLPLMAWFAIAGSACLSLAVGWLRSAPTTRHMLTNSQMSGALSVFLGTQQSLCLPRVGERIYAGERGRAQVLDDTGQMPLGMALPEGASFKGRHDAILTELGRIARFSGISFTQEVYGEFARQFRPRDKEAYFERRRLEAVAGGRDPDRVPSQTHGLVPDARIGKAHGDALSGLVELKTMSPNLAHYETIPFLRKPFEMRAGEVEKDYMRKLREIEGVDGPAAQYLISQGGVTPMVVGQFNEVNPMIDAFLQDCAASRISPGMQREIVKQQYPGAYSVVINMLRMDLSVVLAKGLPDRLAAVMQFVGEGGETAFDQHRRRRIAESTFRVVQGDLWQLTAHNGGVAKSLARPIPRG
jgi:hypothetical protein